MAKRKDSPDTDKKMGMRLELTAPERDRLRILAAQHGYSSMSAFLRQLVIEFLRDPGPMLKKIPKKLSE